MTKKGFKEEWPKVKKQLVAFSKEAMALVKEGEKNIIRLSKEGKLRVDAAALGIKKEHLFYLIGKEFVRSNVDAALGPQLKKLVDELNGIDKQLKALNKKIK